MPHRGSEVGSWTRADQSQSLRKRSGNIGMAISSRFPAHAALAVTNPAGHTVVTKMPSPACVWCGLSVSRSMKPGLRATATSTGISWKSRAASASRRRPHEILPHTRKEFAQLERHNHFYAALGHIECWPKAVMSPLSNSEGKPAPDHPWRRSPSEKPNSPGSPHLP